MGYSTRKIGIKNVDARQRIINKKHTKLTYGERLAKPKTYTGIRVELAKSDNVEDKEKLKKQRGRKSFAEIAIELGVFDEITDAIADWVLLNPFFNTRELMEFLMREFEQVFSDCKTKYPQNFYKNIERVDEWREALDTARIDVDRAVLRNLHKRAVKGLREEVDKDGKYYEIGMKDKDAMEYIRLLHDIKQWEKEEQLNEKGVNESDGVIFAFDEDGDMND